MTRRRSGCEPGLRLPCPLAGHPSTGWRYRTVCSRLSQRRTHAAPDGPPLGVHHLHAREDLDPLEARPAQLAPDALLDDELVVGQSTAGVDAVEARDGPRLHAQAP